MSYKTSAPSAADDLLANHRYAAIISSAFSAYDPMLLSMTGIEQLGEPFHYRVRILCARRIRTFTDMVGKPLTIGLKLVDGRTRYFNGIVQTFSFAGTADAKRPLYIAEIVPWFALLKLRHNSRIFHNMTSIEIASKIFENHASADFDNTRIRDTPPKRIYCVQYNETDFDFVSRLLEQDGIYYFFAHQEDNHKMILTDGKHEPCQPSVINTNLSLKHHRTHDDTFWHWEEEVSLQPGQIVLKDYDHEKPRVTLESREPVQAVPTGGVATLEEERAFDGLSKGPSGEQQAMTKAGPNAARHELFFYPGYYTEQDAGDFYARIRSQEIGCRAYRVRITGDVRQLCPGNTFRASNPFEITNTKSAPEPTTSWLAVRAEIEIRGEFAGDSDEEPLPFRAARTESEPDVPYLYRCTIEAQPAGNPFRPPLRTPRPVISGPQTALVVGDSNETITTDDLGRIKVRFHWAREQQSTAAGSPSTRGADASSQDSCWVRVAQSWAGTNFGGLVTPRVGHEVVVEFINGNPDWPLVTGAVYNRTNTPPGIMPKEATRSTFKTRSIDSKDGLAFNELRFEDAQGLEEVYLKAQKDWLVEVGNDYDIEIRHEYKMTLGAGGAEAPSPAPSGPCSSITATPEKIALVVAGPAGKQAIEITTEGIFIIGANVGLMAVGEGANVGLMAVGQGARVTSMPPPMPAPSPLLVKAKLELEGGLGAPDVPKA